jgi:hypothetical protein
VLILDFFQEWASARNLCNGLPIYANQEITAERYLGYRRQPDDLFFIEINAHPPTAVLLALPFAALDYREAFFAWSLFSLAALVVSLAVVVRQLGIAFSPWLLVPAATLLLLCNPLRQQINQGQLNLVLLLLITGAWAADRTGRPWQAGVWLGLATAVKLIPGFLFLYFLLRRQWKPVVAGIGAFVATTVLTAAVLGLETYQSYVTDVIPKVAEWRSGWNNSSLPGLWNKLFDPGTMGGYVQPVLRAPLLAKLGTLLSCAAVIAVLAPTVWRARSRTDEDLAFGLMIVAMLLVSPVAWEHYFVLLPLPLVLLWRHLPPRGVSRWLFRGLLVILWLSPAVFYYLLMRVGWHQRGQYVAPPAQTLTALSLQLYALLALFFLGLFVAGKLRRQGNSVASTSPSGTAPQPALLTLTEDLPPPGGCVLEHVPVQGGMNVGQLATPPPHDLGGRGE